MGKAKEVRAFAKALAEGKAPGEISPELEEVLSALGAVPGFGEISLKSVSLASAVYARKPGDGSAREQAASCQRVLGGGANIAREYATKRYRSNLINWGMVPFLLHGDPSFSAGSWIFIPGIRQAMERGEMEFSAYVAGKGSFEKITLETGVLTEDERAVILAGSLINYNRERKS